MVSAGKRLLVLGLVSVVVFVAGGCATSSTSGAFKSYADSFNKARPSMGSNDMTVIDSIYAKDAARRDGQGMLANWELAAADEAVGRWAESRDHFLLADAIARDLESKAVVSGSDVAKTAGSLLTNDNTIEFKGDAYEKVMAHTLNALNYIALGDLTGARVEVRKADEYQQLELEKHAKALQAAEQKDSQADQQRPATSELTEELGKMDSFTAGVKNSFQNSFTYFLSGLVYEMNGEADDALIDYRKALELTPECDPIRESVQRLSGAEPNVAAPAADQGEVVIIYEEGLVPEKQEVKFPVPLPWGSISYTAFPVYTDFTPTAERLEVSIAGRSVETEPLIDMHVLAVKALKEKWVGITAREIARVVAKETAQRETAKQAQKQGGVGAELVANLFGLIYKAASTRADLRAFYGLPDEVQVARVVMPVGQYDVRLRRVNAQAQALEKDVQLTVVAGNKTIVVVRGLQTTINSFSIGG
ncbi:MAG: hypothetical protein M0000_07705 [Actinomycetota bacterium]|nr:hypothetical protein [Actinomycetota bacterium]